MDSPVLGHQTGATWTSQLSIEQEQHTNKLPCWHPILDSPVGHQTGATWTSQISIKQEQHTNKLPYWHPILDSPDGHQTGATWTSQLSIEQEQHTNKLPCWHPIWSPQLDTKQGQPFLVDTPLFLRTSFLGGPTTLHIKSIGRAGGMTYFWSFACPD